MRGPVGGLAMERLAPGSLARAQVFKYLKISLNLFKSIEISFKCLRVPSDAIWLVQCTAVETSRS